MIAGYIRVSTLDQKTDAQKAEIAAWAKAHKLGKVKWYEDRISGKDTKRPALDQLRKDVFAGKVKTVLVWKLDRLARSLRDGVNLLGDWCDKGVRIVSITQQIDLSGTLGQLMASTMFGIAEIELSNIRERQAAGIAVAKKKGVYSGRKKGTTKAKPERAKALHEQGLKPWEIANALGVSDRTVKNYLKLV